MGSIQSLPFDWICLAAFPWYGSFEWAERGFFSKCGTILFYRLRQASDDLIPTAGSLGDPASVTAIERHIFSDEKLSYCDSADDTPRTIGDEVIAAFNTEQDDQ